MERRAAGYLDFLMPMQDAKFFDGTRVGELGKCVFAFMGGIFHDDEQFLKWTRGLGKQLKGPDFHSRLQSQSTAAQCDTQTVLYSFTSSDTAKLTRAILIRIYLREHKSIKLIQEMC